MAEHRLGADRKCLVCCSAFGPHREPQYPCPYWFEHADCIGVLVCCNCQEILISLAVPVLWPLIVWSPGYKFFSLVDRYICSIYCFFCTPVGSATLPRSLCHCIRVRLVLLNPCACYNMSTTYFFSSGICMCEHAHVSLLKTGHPPPSPASPPPPPAHFYTVVILGTCVIIGENMVHYLAELSFNRKSK